MTDMTEDMLPAHIDPVCGMAVDPDTAVASAEHEGTTYYFCSQDCYRTFTENPSSYVGS